MSEMELLSEEQRAFFVLSNLDKLIDVRTVLATLLLKGEVTSESRGLVERALKYSRPIRGSR